MRTAGTTYGTLVMQSRDFTKHGAASDWGYRRNTWKISTESLSARFRPLLSISGLTASILRTGPAQSSRRFSTAGIPRREIVKTNSAERVGAGGSANTVEFGGIYPTFVDLKEMSDLGFDVFCHGHQLSGSGTLRRWLDRLRKTRLARFWRSSAWRCSVPVLIRLGCAGISGAKHRKWCVLTWHPALRAQGIHALTRRYD